MLKRNVIYPAVITKEDGVYYIGLVDFDKLENGDVDYYSTYSEDFEKLGTVIREALVLYLADFLDMRKKFPEPSN